MGTLSDIESGKAVPHVATLHALSIVYRTSMGMLAGCLTEERLLREAGDLGEAVGERLHDLYVGLTAAGEWERALAVTVLGERRASTARAALAWRCNRSSCIGMLGMREEAVVAATECCESPLLSPLQRYLMLHNLAVAHVHAGSPWQACMVLDAAESLVGEARPDPRIARGVSLLRAGITLERHVDGLPVSEPEVRDGIRRLDKALEGASGSDRGFVLRTRLERAGLYSALGNHLVARRDAEASLRECQEFDDPALLGDAHSICGLVALDAGDPQRAARHHEAAVAPYEKACRHGNVFDACFRLFKLLRHERPGRATKFLRRCDALASVVTSRTPLWKEYVGVIRARA